MGLTLLGSTRKTIQTQTLNRDHACKYPHNCMILAFIFILELNCKTYFFSVVIMFCKYTLNNNYVEIKINVADSIPRHYMPLKTTPTT